MKPGLKPTITQGKVSLVGELLLEIRQTHLQLRQMVGFTTGGTEMTLSMFLVVPIYSIILGTM